MTGNWRDRTTTGFNCKKQPAIGSRGRVSEVLTRKRPLTLPMVRQLSALLQIPTDVLVQPYATRTAA